MSIDSNEILFWINDLFNIFHGKSKLLARSDFDKKKFSPALERRRAEIANPNLGLRRSSRPTLLTRAAPRQHNGCVTIPLPRVITMPRSVSRRRASLASHIPRVARPASPLSGAFLACASRAFPSPRPAGPRRARADATVASPRAHARDALVVSPHPAHPRPRGLGSALDAAPSVRTAAVRPSRLTERIFPSPVASRRHHQEPTNTSRSSGRRSRAMCSASSSACACGSTASSPPWCA